MGDRVIDEVRVRREPRVRALDPALPGMALLGEPTRLGEVLSGRLGDGLGCAGGLLVSRVGIRRHWPGRRCTAELSLTVRRRGEAPEVRRVAAKCYSDDRGAGVYATMRELRTHGLGAGRFLVARPLAYDAEYRLLVLEWAEGESLRSRLVASGDAGRSVEGAAAWLLRLHGCGVTAGRPYTLRRHLLTLSEWARQLTRAFPEGERLLTELMAGIEGAAHVLTVPEVTPTHRDYSPEHLVTAGDVLVGLDFDEFCQYDPLFDVAHFTAHVRFLGLIRRGGLEAFDGLADRFWSSYQAGRADGCDERRKGLYESIAYLKLARFVALVRRPPNWRDILLCVLTEAVRMVDRHAG